MWKKGLILVVIIIISLFLSYYCFLLQVQIFCVQPGDFGILVWCSGPAGTYFPLPIESGYSAVITTSNSLIDYLLYVFIISTNLIYLLTLGSWLTSIILGYKWIYRYIYPSKTEKSK